MSQDAFKQRSVGPMRPVLPANAGSDISRGTAGVVVAVCNGHWCAALARAGGDRGLGGAVSRSLGGVLISVPCLQQCAHGAVGAVAIREGLVTGRSAWLGGLEAEGQLQDLGRWVQGWRPGSEDTNTLPKSLREAVIGFGPPINLTPIKPH